MINPPVLFIIFSMNTFDKIKLTLASGSGKCVVLHDENPKYVVMTWQEYQKMVEYAERLKNSDSIDINEIPV